MPNNPVQFHLGVVTARDASTLRDGELALATGAEYRIGSPHVYKLPGRTIKGALGAAVVAINKVQYDTGTDKLVAVAGGTVYGSTVSTTPTFASEGLTGLNATAVPHFGAFQDRWVMLNGVDGNYIREPANVPGTSSPWRLILQSPAKAPTGVVSTTPGAEQRPSSHTGSYTLPNNAIDGSVTTKAMASTGEINGPTTVTSTWTWTADPTGNNRVLKVIHRGKSFAGSPEIINSPKANPDLDFSDSGTATHKIEYTLDVTAPTPTWVTLYQATGSYSQRNDTTAVGVLVNSTNYANKLAVRATLTNFSGGPNFGEIYDIAVVTGSTTTYGFTNKVVYLYTEEYIDSDNQRHETAGSPPLEFEVGTVSGAYKIDITVPSRTNSYATNYRFYRSVDEVGGGYPNMYEIGSLPASASSVTFIEDFSLPTTTVPDNRDLYQIYEVLYYTGDTIQFELNTPPPPSKMSLPFQGCMVYVPSNSTLARRLYYSVPSSISSIGIEQVPPVHYLEFITPKNDSIVSIATCNGGLTLLVFFADYTMVVGLLPQATDPGVFDSRVKEYVSNVRGAAGRFCVTEFTLPTGETLVAAVDRLGLWVTNGSSEVQEWSRDLDWDSTMAGVDLSTAELYHNPIKRRLELIYTSGGARKELHFFYGRMKQDGDGKPAPLLSSPNTITLRCRYYGLVGTQYVGFSGDGTSTGNIYLEGGDVDASNAHDSSGSVPFRVRTGFMYLGGLGRAHLCEFGYPKFATTLSKVVLATGTFVMDAGTTREVVQSFTAGGMKKLWWHAYADRHSIEFSDISATACPALVAYEVEVRDAGVGRIK